MRPAYYLLIAVSAIYLIYVIFVSYLFTILFFGAGTNVVIPLSFVAAILLENGLNNFLYRHNIQPEDLL